ncbi:unnamed protein product, partial [Ixodes pacificus]
QRPAVSAWRPPGKKKRRSRRRPRPKSCGTIADGRAHNVKGVAEWARPLAVNKAGTRKKPAPSAQATRRRGQSLAGTRPRRAVAPLDSRGSIAGRRTLRWQRGRGILRGIHLRVERGHTSAALFH